MNIYIIKCHLITYLVYHGYWNYYFQIFFMCIWYMHAWLCYSSLYYINVHLYCHLHSRHQQPIWTYTTFLVYIGVLLHLQWVFLYYENDWRFGYTIIYIIITNVQVIFHCLNTSVCHHQLFWIFYICIPCLYFIWRRREINSPCISAVYCTLSRQSHVPT